MIKNNNSNDKDKANAAKVAEAIRAQIMANTADYTEAELWQLLAAVSSKSLTNKPAQSEIMSNSIQVAQPIPNKAIISRNKVEYVSVSDDAAAAMIYAYLVSIEANKDDSRNLVKIHTAFNGNVANATHANRRLMYSYYFRNECAIYNSIPAKVAEAYNKQPKKLDKIQRKFVDNYLVNNPEFAAKLRSYKNSHYVKAVVAAA